MPTLTLRTPPRPASGMNHKDPLMAGDLLTFGTRTAASARYRVLSVERRSVALDGTLIEDVTIEEEEAGG